jgi:endo-1,4-beta-xylanase
MLRRLPLSLAVTTAISTAVIALTASSLPAGAQDPGLRADADAAGISFGSAVTLDALSSDGAYRQLLIDNVNMVSTVDEFDVAVVQPLPGVFDFARADAVVDFAEEHDLTVRGHGLIGAGGLPEWITGGSWTAETLGAVLREHVTAIVGRYADRNPGVVTQWDVVDGAFLPDGTPRPTIWQQVIGPEHFRIAFEAARAADPDALLFYDDFYDDLAVTGDAIAAGVDIVPGATAERSTCDQVPKCVAVRSTVTSLVAAGTPIDGIGVQAHLLSPDPFDVGVFSAWIEELGLAWAITEFVVPVPSTEVANPDTLAFKAATYAAGLSACVDAAGCDTFVTWGITDRLPPTPDTTGGAFGGGLWFDATDAPKPAVEAMAEVLGRSAPPPATTTAPTLLESAPTTSAPVATEPDDDDRSSVITAVLVGAVALVGIGVVIALARRGRTSPENEQ